nr:hypothetical protein CFP56_01971 [Quercus suber]
MGHGLDETHGKWGAVYRLEVGGLWQISGLRKEIKDSVCGYGESVDAMRWWVWLQVYGSHQGGAGRGLRKNMGMADHRASRGLRKKTGMGDNCERERERQRQVSIDASNQAVTDSMNPKLSFKDKLISEIPGAFAQAFYLRDKKETEMAPSSIETDMESDEVRELKEGENFLSIRPWEPNFKLATAVVSLVAVWVKFNELPIEYYDSEASSSSVKPLGMS